MAGEKRDSIRAARTRSRSSVRTGAAVDTLEPRRLMSLLGVTVTPPSFFYVDTATVQYQAPASPGTGTFDVTAHALSFSIDPINTCPVLLSPADGLAAHLLINSTDGNLVNGGIGSTLTVKGGIDLNHDGQIAPNEPSGTLFQGQVTAFGFRDTGTTSDSFDMRVTPTGGILAAHFGQFVGVTLASDNSTFVNTFASSFSGDARGNVGAIKRVIGDFVWSDVDGDGVQDAGEPGINGVTVNLRDALGVLKATTTTAHNYVSNSDGYYSFDNLATGSYQVEFVAPLGRILSPQAAGGDVTTDSDANPGTGLAQVTLTTASPSSDVSIDAGMVLLPSWLEPHSQVQWNPVTKALTVTGGATIVADPGADNPAITASGSSAVLTINPLADAQVHVGSLTLSNGAKAVLSSHGTGSTLALVISGGTPSITADSVLDLADNAAVLKNADAAAGRTLLAAGFNGGRWDRVGGITSSSAASDAAHATALGYAANAALSATSFAGVTGLTGADVLVRFTYAGDANLDGKVDIGDLGLLSGSWQQPSGKSWFDGDFTYDCVVDIGDLGLLSGNWQKGTTGNPL